MKKIHLWIGTTKADEETYLKYFDQEDEVSQFSKDIGLDEEYDEDFVSFLPLFDDQKPVSEILRNEVPLDANSVAMAITACGRMGIETANAVFYLTDSTVIIDEPYKDSYNGLSYLGVFGSSL